jgi:tetratricopeptide (TPR) repeat protein
VDAVAVYEQGLRMLQHHDYAKASELMRHVIATFPEERELVERARLYVTLCDRQLKPLTSVPQNTTERIYAATLALNAGDADEAVGHLARALADEPSNDKALYMLATAHAQRAETEDAIRYLQQAIEANPENRSLARFDPDLHALRSDETVTALLEAPSVARDGEQRRSIRRR